MGQELAKSRRAPVSTMFGCCPKAVEVWPMCVVLVLPASTGVLIKNILVGSSSALPSLGLSDGFIRVWLFLQAPPGWTQEIAFPSTPVNLFFCTAFV